MISARMSPNKVYNGFIQTSDIHIGECRKLENYILRHKKVLWQILELAEQKHKCLLIPGDLFHRKDTKYEELMLAVEFILEAERREIQTIITAGNHDHIKGSKTQLDFFKDIPFTNVYICGWEPEIVRIGNMGVICLAWQGYTTKKIDELVRIMYPHIQDAEHKIVMLHEFIYGSKMDNGKIINQGTKIPNIPEIDYWAIGDVHTHQPTNVSNAWYAGAPLQFKFDDVTEKGAIEVNLPYESKPTYYPLSFKKLLTINSVEEISEDAHYYVKGDIGSVLEANRDARVIRSDWQRPETVAFEKPKVGITEGLADNLASAGISAQQQKECVSWVKQLLQIKE